MADATDISQAFTLQVLTPARLIEDASVSLASFPGAEGDFGVLPGHMPLITHLKPGVISYEEGGMPRRIAISSGVVEVTPERVIVLAKTAEPSTDVDRERAASAKKDYESRLSAISRDHDDWAELEHKLNTALARIEAAEGKASSH